MYRNALLRANTVDVIGRPGSADWQSKNYPTDYVVNTLKTGPSGRQTIHVSILADKCIDKWQ
jgi:hypothetical protein